jgi:two-component system, cell cycle response regulator
LSTEPKPKLLLIDDSEDTHKQLRARLKYEHVELLSAMGGAAGIEMARAERPACILLDLDMPEMDGFQVLRALKDGVTTNTPVVVLSGTNSPEDKVTAFDLGANDFVIKNLANAGDIAELKARIRAVLRLERLLRLLSERAELDGLTGLSNRAAFNRRWSQAVAENKRYGHALTLMLFDIDHFKRVNDAFGHPAGDEVLIEFGRIVQSCSRASDVACRFGGEEFALILTGTGPVDATVVAERVRTGLQAVVWPRHPEHQVTVSIGLAGSDSSAPADLTLEAWIEACDKALYQAKHGGRNRVICSPLAVPVAASK